MDNDDQLDGQTEQPSPSAPAATATSAESVRNSPEYQELAKQNRNLARQLGSQQKAVAEARAEAERARQAAEAERVAALESEVRSVLGDEGVAAWAEIAELSSSDQVAAARKFAELMQGRAQNPSPAEAPAAGAQETRVEQQPTTPPMRSVDASVPLAQPTTQEDYAAIASDLEQQYVALVEKNQNVVTRNRTTMKDRAAGMIAYLGAAYLKAGVKPKG